MATTVKIQIQRRDNDEIVATFRGNAGRRKLDQHRHDWRNNEVRPWAEVFRVLVDGVPFHEVPCTGEAHDPRVGGMIDNCWSCAPRWAVIEIPEQFASVTELRAANYQGPWLPKGR
jgi:hypothetical protein